MIAKNAWNKKYNMYDNRIPVKFLIQGKEKTVHDYMEQLKIEPIFTKKKLPRLILRMSLTIFITCQVS